MPINERWTGEVYGGFEASDLYRYRIGRTGITVDNIWFTLLTQNNNPIHFEHGRVAKTVFRMTSYEVPLIE